MKFPCRLEFAWQPAYKTHPSSKDESCYLYWLDLDSSGTVDGGKMNEQPGSHQVRAGLEFYPLLPGIYPLEAILLLAVQPLQAEARLWLGASQPVRQEQRLYAAVPFQAKTDPAIPVLERAERGEQAGG